GLNGESNPSFPWRTQWPGLVLAAARLEVRIESDNAHPMILQENTSVTKAVYTNPCLGAHLGNNQPPTAD
ncbi:hypothetical protein ACDL36_11740, partial [Corynebacterium diphtheriae]|uniref:hypothetical protein n=1 Tax=Corynebacterium diphtheriae TaxID=1717 RepID=UPI003530BD62